MKEETAIKKYMTMPLPKLQRLADKEFQMRRRLETADSNGIVNCISCNAFKMFDMVDSGHYIQRSHKGVRYHSDNVWPQCKKCNQYLHGNHAKYHDGLVKKIGEGGIAWLQVNKDALVPGGWREWCIKTILESRKIIKAEKERIGIC